MDDSTPVLSCTIGTITLPNPVIAASGTAGYGTEGPPHLMCEELGAIVIKGLSLRPRAGNPPPRIAETPCGMLNSIGLQNIGVDAFLAEHLPLLQDRKARVVVNVFGESQEEYVEVVEKLHGHGGILAVELNVSCPNVEKGGRAFSKDPEVLHGLVKRVKATTSMPLWVKLSPEGGEFGEALRACSEAGCNGFTIANTYVGMAVDVETRTPKLYTGIGGLSGPAVRPLTLYRVWLAVRTVSVPIIASGGIASATDALEYLIVGARAVQIGSAAFGDPNLYRKVVEGIKAYLIRHGHSSLEEIIGTVRRMPSPVW